jgi:hypothetical protein
MQIGLNTDIVHQGKTLHIQTEDVHGTQRYLITHLFLAGSIIDSQRLDYEEELSEEELKSLIRTQHQSVIRALLSGHYNRRLLLHRPRAHTQRDIPLARESTSSTSDLHTRQEDQENEG